MQIIAISAEWETLKWIPCPSPAMYGFPFGPAWIGIDCGGSFRAELRSVRRVPRVTT